ncbi:GDP-mannose 4,6-dehydratase [Alphaproteobacteria bacterium]|nr:GDP-mannose 4,6-dehydratase [Alphaproteobacteria bacterium]
MDRFLIIGSNSFSGAQFCKMLLSRGYNVFGVSRSAEQEMIFAPYQWDQEASKNFQFQTLDINSDLGDFEKILYKFQPHYIVNFAAQSMVAQSWEFPQHWVNTNVLAITKLIDILKGYDRLEKFVQVTTPEVYGSTPFKIKEETLFQPSTPYAVSRAAGDMMLKIYQEQFGLPVNFTRAANVYGPGQQLYRIIPRTILACFTGKKLVLDGGGLSERAFIHIDDVSLATLSIAHSKLMGESFHISTDEFVSIRALVEKIVDMTGFQFGDVVTIGSERLGKDHAYLLDSTKLRESIGWAETISLEQGIEETISWVKNNLQVLRTKEIGYVHKP